MRRVLSVAFLAACVGLGVAQARDEASTTDQQFVTQASAGGLAEVNFGTLAAKQGTNAAVRKFAQHMVNDHTKANKELISLANRKKFKVAATMDSEHQTLSTKLSKLSGAAFDREYMASQVKDHETTVSLFEKEAKDGKDDDLRGWAKKTLPTLRKHLKMARTIQGKLGGDASR